MTLTKYRAKRKFNQTPEPQGKVSKGKSLLRFVIQKHDASHLHYDFRLELDGVLKSWAVPKGPSLNPTDKRLAMQVEDHPFDYRTFEGDIPEGNYGAGEVIVWDEGRYYVEKQASRSENEGLIRAGLKKGRLTFFIEGHKLQGEFTLVRMAGKRQGDKKETWLLIKSQDDYATDVDVLTQVQSVRSSRILSRDKDAGASLSRKGKTSVQRTLRQLPTEKMDESVTPMLATLVDKPFNRKDWLFEIKWDGYRAIAEVNDGKVNLYSRKQKSFMTRFPEIVEALKEIDHNVVLDGEVVALDEEGKLSFQKLQDSQKNRTRLAYYVFDLLYLDGKNVQGLPLKERKALLRDILQDTEQIRYSDHVENKGVDFFDVALKEGLEGIMAKDGNSPYLQGQRTGAWLKIKSHHRQEVVIAGYTDPKGSRKNMGALILGVYEDGQFKYIGHTGTGFDTKSLSSLKKKLDKYLTDKCPFEKTPKTNAKAHWVKPNIVAEVRFQEWTNDGRMRQPVFMGLREDKSAKEVIREPELSPEKAMKRSSKKADTVKSNKSKSSSKQKVTLTHPDKIYWPEKGYTKGDLLDYYESVSDLILPYLKDRPIVLNRFPNGIHGSSFYQKDFTDDLPSFVETVEVYSESNNKNLRMILCQNKDTLLYLANLGCIEMNPWNSRKQALDNPDYMILDLDPGEIGFDKVIKTAQVVKEVLDEMDIESYCKTSGATGLHIFVPMKAKYDYDTVKEFAHLVVSMVHERLPKYTSIERSPAKRKDKIYLDYLQNTFGQTIASVYSVRPRVDASISTPLAWGEVVKGLDPKAFNLKTIHARLAETGDMWKPVLGKGIQINKALKKLDSK